MLRNGRSHPSSQPCTVPWNGAAERPAVPGEGDQRRRRARSAAATAARADRAARARRAPARRRAPSTTTRRRRRPRSSRRAATPRRSADTPPSCPRRAASRWRTWWRWWCRPARCTAGSSRRTPRAAAAVRPTTPSPAITPGIHHASSARCRRPAGRLSRYSADRQQRGQRRGGVDPAHEGHEQRRAGGGDTGAARRVGERQQHPRQQRPGQRGRRGGADDDGEHRPQRVPGRAQQPGRRAADAQPLRQPQRTPERHRDTTSDIHSRSASHTGMWRRSVSA